MTQREINIWEAENFSRIVKWVKDFQNSTITFVFDNPANGEEITFNIVTE